MAETGSKFAAVLSYDGTNYRGWQLQKDTEEGPRPSIQETLQKTLFQMTGEEPEVVGSGRTDSGVHAAGQVAHFVLGRKAWEPEALRKGLNALLPAAIRVRKLIPAPNDFHAQFQARKKRYGYY